jgi:hypothetical protein
MQYREQKQDTKEFKQTYIDGINRLIRARQQDAEQKRSAYVKDIFTDPDAYRADFRKMLGWPLVEHNETALPAVKKTKLADEQGYCIYRMQFEILEGLELTGLYFEMNGEGKRPLVLVQHGGLGTPEAISGVYGDTTNYNCMLERVIAHGVHAFAPQLLLWSNEKYEVSFDRANIDSRLKRVGSSITAVELYGLMRVLDYFEAQNRFSDFGMVGLSYGGFYTLFLSALDVRIKSAISCSFFNTRDQITWSDWTWFRSAEQFDDAEVACLVYPRKLCIEIGTKDELFDYQYGVKSFEKLTALCENVGTDWVKLIQFEGIHEFCRDDQPIRELIGHLTGGTV